VTRVLLDVDGPLADFAGGLVGALRRRGFRGSPADIRHWCLRTSLSDEAHAEVDTILSTPGFVRSLSWMPGARWFVRELRRLGCDVACVTSPWPSRSWIPERLEWLSPLFSLDDVLFVRSARKPMIRGDVLVEDHPGTAAAWLEAHPEGTAILVDRPWNQPTSKEYVEHPRMRRARTVVYAAALILELVR
jgi:5'(3')-deoxyribonucleotidase